MHEATKVGGLLFSETRASEARLDVALEGTEVRVTKWQSRNLSLLSCSFLISKAVHSVLSLASSEGVQSSKQET